MSGIKKLEAENELLFNLLLESWSKAQPSVDEFDIRLQIENTLHDQCADLKDSERDLPDYLDDSADDCIEYNDAGEPRGYM